MQKEASPIQIFSFNLWDIQDLLLLIHMFLNLNSGEFSMNFMNISCARVEGISVLRGLLGIRQAFRRFMWFVYEVHKKFTEYHKTKVPGRKSISLIRCQKENWKSECLLHWRQIQMQHNLENGASESKIVMKFNWNGGVWTKIR